MKRVAVEGPHPAWLIAFILAVIAASLLMTLAGCGSSPTAPLTPSPEPSVSPEPTLQVFVKAQATQGGQPTTGVSARSDFKISGTATQCFSSGVSVPCPVIPRWHQEQVGGFDAGCTPFGSLTSPAVTWNCSEESKAVSIEVSAESLDGRVLGSDIVVVWVG